MKKNTGSGDSDTKAIPKGAEVSLAEDGYPVNVVNKQAYDKFQEARDALYNFPDNPFVCPEFNINVNLLMPVGNVRRAIKHASDEVKDEVEDLVNQIQKLKADVSRYKRQAMGMTRKKYGHRDDLTIALESRKAEIIDLFGMYYSTKEVHAIVNLEWKYDVSILTLRKFYNDNMTVIMQKRDMYVKTASDIRLGHKRSRLEELSSLFRSRKGIYNNSKSRADSVEMRNILADIRKEVEGERIMIDGEIRIQQDTAIDSHVHKMLMNELSIKTIVVARVAAKLKLNPLILMERLSNSYYSKYNGFAEKNEGEEVVYPSQLVYDFDRMRRGKALLKDEKPLDEAIVISEAKHDSLDKLKSELMKRLIARQNLIKNEEEEVGK